MPQVIPLTAAPHGFGKTSRRDTWWTTPLAVFAGFTTFIVYSTWAALQNAHYISGPYLSPFYAPLLFVSPGAPGLEHAWFGTVPAWWPAFVPFSPALLILPFPGLFRFTCYYYRGAYYKAFWADPPACSVGEPRTSYLGENSFPLILQNIHRYAYYIAVLFIFMLAYDVWLATRFPVVGAPGQHEFGVGVGTLVLAVNVVLLASYTFGCHSGRHIFGGRKDEVSKSPALSACYDCVTSLNTRHMLFAWMSLFSVGLSDVYVRLCSMGVLHDWRIL